METCCFSALTHGNAFMHCERKVMHSPAMADRVEVLALLEAKGGACQVWLDDLCAVGGDNLQQLLNQHLVFLRTPSRTEHAHQRLTALQSACCTAQSVSVPGQSPSASSPSAPAAWGCLGGCAALGKDWCCQWMAVRLRSWRDALDAASGNAADTAVQTNGREA